MIDEDQTPPEQANDPLGQSYITFDSSGSYDNLNLVKVDPKPKPDLIPSLQFIGLPEYESSEEEEQQVPAHDDMYYAALQGQKNKNKSF